MLTQLVRQAALEALMPVTPEKVEQSRVNLREARRHGDDRMIRKFKGHLDYLRKSLCVKDDALTFFREVFGMGETEIRQMLARMPRLRRV